MKNNHYSTTALLIAKAHVFLSTDLEFKHLVSPEALSWSLRFIETATGKKNYNKRCQKKSYRWFISGYEKLICPGIIRHYLRRKQYIEQQTHRILAEGKTNRVVIMAGGFDTLALRLASQYPQIEFVELDHPATQKVKIQAVGTDQPENLQFIQIDYTQNNLEDVLDVLESSATLFIAEGLLMYLPEHDVRALFESMKTVSPMLRHLIFTYLPDEQKTESFMCKMWLKLKNEQLNWTASSDHLSELVNTAFQRIDSNRQVSSGASANHLLRETTCVATA